MVELHPLSLDGENFVAIEVQLPKTTLVIIQCEVGYVMCGALDIPLLRTKLANRGIVAARAVGVKTVQQLLDATVESSTQEAEALGINAGLPIRDALHLMKGQATKRD
ncbi:MAG: hypothetical protein A2201_09560 [Alicyclobacillus sp. RIFOXYA1_FULL_53_8]|nr:MAG: hypothetical protein A2201_09560 [Alicyclobacillus sp. RIFOXYA1_FULL_53_8]